jgi:hypothetical protein
MSVAHIALAGVFAFGLIGVAALIISKFNSKAASSTDPNVSGGAQRQKIGFPIRGVGFFMSQGDEIEDYAYAWPYVAKFCLGSAILVLTVTLVIWVAS